jgi:hypothetical protein
VPSVVETTRRVQPVHWASILLIVAISGLAIEWGVRGSRWGALP